MKLSSPPVEIPSVSASRAGHGFQHRALGMEQEELTKKKQNSI
jgi:hypothetical protein